MKETPFLVFPPHGHFYCRSWFQVLSGIPLWDMACPLNLHQETSSEAREQAAAVAPALKGQDGGGRSGWS